MLMNIETLISVDHKDYQNNYNSSLNRKWDCKQIYIIGTKCTHTNSETHFMFPDI